MAAAARQLSAAELAFYREHGFVRVDRLITAAQVAELSADYDAAIAEEYGDLRWTGRRVEGRMVQLGNAQRVIEHWKTHDYMRHASAIARQLEGEDIQYSYDQIIMKPPHYPKETEWHQDAGYWQNDRACTCWLALSPATAASGAMQFVPGSHLHGILPHVDASGYSEINDALEADLSQLESGAGGSSSDGSSGPGSGSGSRSGSISSRSSSSGGGGGGDASRLLSVEAAVTVELEPGSCTFHHCRTLHYAGGNATDWPRKGLITHFQPPPAPPAAATTGATVVEAKDGPKL